MTWASGAWLGTLAAAGWMAACSGEALPTEGGAGSGGVGGGGASGTGGSPGMGQGGGGAGGVGGGSGGGGSGVPCGNDAGCTAPGSLCVQSVCTAATGECKLASLVVVAANFTGSVTDAPLGACYYRTLDEAVADLAPGTTKALSVYAAAAGAKAPLDVTGLVFEGHGPTAGAAVALAVTAVPPAPLVRLGEGSVVRGFSLAGASGQKGFGIEAGNAVLTGPLTITGLSPALSVEGTGSVTIDGKASAPVTFVNNERGIFVAGTAGLEMTGEGGDSLVVENATKGAGLLVDKGGSSAAVTVTKATFRLNQGSGVGAGQGAIEVRGGRQVLVEACTFEKNQRSVTLNAGSTLDANLFLGVKISGNNFNDALPQGDQGAAVCGSEFAVAGTKIQLNLEANIFPSQAVCDDIAPADNCISGVDVGYDVPNFAPTLVCPPTASP